MPIYEFECESCGEEFEKVLPIDFDESKICCPICAMIAKKIISAANFKVDKYAHKPLKKSRPKSYVPTLRDLGLDKESKKKLRKEMGKDLIINK